MIPEDKQISEAYATALTKYDISDNYKLLVPIQDLPKVRLFMNQLKRGIIPQKDNLTAYMPIIELVDRVIENGPDAVEQLKTLAFRGDHTKV